jgi:magnesium chelatase accessory protein
VSAVATATEAAWTVGTVSWHVQRWAPPRGRDAPLLLLLHGTGSASFSWRHLAPRLAKRFEVLAPDLPGHGRTRVPANADLSLDGMVRQIQALLTTARLRPTAAIAHSAGAAIGAAWSLNRVSGNADGDASAPVPVIGLNAALRPLGGIGKLFSPLARALAFNPLVPGFFSWHASQPAVLRRLLRSTGSKVDAEGERLYRELLADSRHTAGALRMMASWDLAPLQERLPALGPALHLIAGTADTTVPAAESRAVHDAVPGSRLTLLPGLGHLAHEEDAEAVLAALEPSLAMALEHAARKHRA